MDYLKDSTAKLCQVWGMEGSVCWQGGRSGSVPRVWFAFFVVMLICLDHERSSTMVTPKYFAAGTLSNSAL